MRFRNSSYHRSSFIEEIASNLSAIEFIIGFRRRHRTLFNVIFTMVIIFIISSIILLMVINQQNSRIAVTGTNGTRAPISGNQSQIYINQPTDVETENDIEHERTSDNFFSSTIRYSFDTDFLIGNGVGDGDLYRLTLSIVYRGSDGVVYTTDDDYIEIVVGERAGLTTELINPIGFISVDDILGYNLK